ncbi:hypothetical protein ACIBIZ_08705 [Nonomuraea spiralis]|uniref:hypothetical protein n=1 Tax=Nonomuraea TaxID=83681 RepID=UPI001C8C74F4|nr:hypothetical protein [Nonomuraea sp. WAC 01424]
MGAGRKPTQTGKPTLSDAPALETGDEIDPKIGDWRATMRPSAEDTVDGVLADHRKTVERANQVIDTCPDLALPATGAQRTP